MRKTRLFAAGTLALFLASVGGVGATSQVAAQGTPTVTPSMTVTTSGNQATFVILVKNNRSGLRGDGSPYNLQRVEVKGKVPDGTTVTQTWATHGPGINPGVFTGGDRAVGWIKPGLGAGKTEGPYVFTVDTGGKQVCSFAWIKVDAREDSGSWRTNDVCTGAAATAGTGGGTSGGGAPQPLQPLPGR